MARKRTQPVVPQIRIRGEQPSDWRSVADSLSHAKPSDLLTARDVAALLGLKRGKAFALLSSGVLPAVRIGTALRIEASELERWIRRDGADSILRDQRRKAERERGD